MKLIETNSDGRYGYGGAKPESTPSSQRVEEAIQQLEIGWWEAFQMRNFYRWARFWAWLHEPRVYVAGEGLSLWSGVQMVLLTILAIALVIGVLAL